MIFEKIEGLKMDQFKEMTQLLIEESEQKRAWYHQKKKFSGHIAKSVRFLLILGTLKAALVPMLSIVFVDVDGLAVIHPAWSGIITALVGALLAFEKFYGHGKTWVRFNMAEIQIEQEIKKIKFDWEVWKIENEQNNTESVESWLARLKSFQKSVFDIELNETKQWQQEFQMKLEK